MNSYTCCGSQHKLYFQFNNFFYGLQSYYQWIENEFIYRNIQIQLYIAYMYVYFRYENICNVNNVNKLLLHKNFPCDSNFS
jgi:hypothetical protein